MISDRTIRSVLLNSSAAAVLAAVNPHTFYRTPDAFDVWIETIGGALALAVILTVAWWAIFGRKEPQEKAATTFAITLWFVMLMTFPALWEGTAVHAVLIIVVGAALLAFIVAVVYASISGSKRQEPPTR